MHTTPNPERTRAILLLVATAALWSTSGLLIKLISWHPVAIAGMRSAIAGLFLLAVIRRPRLTWSFAQVGGAIAYAACVILFVSANKLTTAANAIVLQYTSPVYVALLGAWFLKERVARLDWCLLFVVMGGMILFFCDKLTFSGLWGNIVSILSGVAYAILVLFLRLQKDGSPRESILLGNALTALIGLPFMFGPPPDTRGWIVLALMGVFQLGLPYLLYTAAIKHVTALEAAVIPMAEPVLNPIWVFLAMGEAPGTWALTGGGLVLAAVTGRCVAGATGEGQSGTNEVRGKMETVNVSRRIKAESWRSRG